MNKKYIVLFSNGKELVISYLERAKLIESFVQSTKESPGSTNHYLLIDGGNFYNGNEIVCIYEETTNKTTNLAEGTDKGSTD